MGRGVAKRLAALGAKVVIWDVNERGNEETKDQILEEKPDAVVYAMKVNLCNREDVYRAAERVCRFSWIIDLCRMERFSDTSGQERCWQCNNRYQQRWYRQRKTVT